VQGQLRKEWGEFRQNFVHDVIPDRGQDLKNIRPLGHRSFERYAELEIELHIHFSAWVVAESTETEQFCATYHRSRLPLRSDSEASVTADVGSFEREKRQVGQAVLVDIREFVKNPQGVTGGVIWPSIVWLQPLDFCLCAIRDVPDSPLATPKALAILGHRELHLPSDVLGKRMSLFSNSKRINEAVEGGTEVVQTLADDETKLDRWRVKGVDPESVLASLRVEFDVDAIRIASQPPLDFDFQAFNVLECPMQL
jgi:hypothetical protein